MSGSLLTCSGHVAAPDRQSPRLRPIVAAADSLKSETFYRDLKILRNHAAERTTATAATIVNGTIISDAEDPTILSPKALERRKCGPLSARAKHALKEVHPAIALDRYMLQFATSHCTA